MTSWKMATLIYVGLSCATFIPVLAAILRGVHLHPGGSSFESSSLFSENAKQRLIQHYSRMQGTLAFWKKQSETYKRLHYYTLLWSIPSSVVVPFLAQATNDDPWSKWMLTIVSAFTAILLAVHRALKVDANYRAFRLGESDFYDTYRRMLDRPRTFGRAEEKQLEAYFDAVENLRKFVRNAETDNLPTLEQVRAQMAAERSPPQELPKGEGD